MAKSVMGGSLVVQWLGLCASIAAGMNLIPGQGTKIPQAMWHGQKQTNKQNQPNKKSVMGLYLCGIHAQFGLQAGKSFLSQLSGQRNT